MIDIQEFKTLCDSIIAQVPDVKDYHLVSHEGHAMTRLGSAAGIQMLILYPSADREGKQGSGIDLNASWIFILEKDDNSQSADQELAQFKKLQAIILEIRHWIEVESETDNILLRRYDPARTKIDPEYREFGGWNGWSMSVVF